jgi:hypothetical protein
MLRGDARRMRRVRPTRRAPRIRWGQAGRVWNFVHALTEVAENRSRDTKLARVLNQTVNSSLHPPQTTLTVAAMGS